MIKGYAPPKEGQFVDVAGPDGRGRRVRFPAGYRLQEEPGFVHIIGPDEKVIGIYTDHANPNEILKDIDVDLQGWWEEYNKTHMNSEGTFFIERDFRLYFPPGLECVQTEKGWYLLERIKKDNEPTFRMINHWDVADFSYMNVRYALEAYQFMKSLSDENPSFWKGFGKPKNRQ